MGLDTAADPPADEVIALREDRMARLREFVAAITADRLEEQSLRARVHNLFDEEWHHNWYANRDLDALTQGTGGSR